jgi:hypothetical protein
MKPAVLRSCLVSLSILFALLLISVSPAGAADGKKWDGNTYPFKLLDQSKANSESNPFIIDTAGKLAYFSWLASRGNDMDFDMAAYGREKGLKGLHPAFKDNYVKLTTDLDMNGSQFEFIAIMGMAVNFDGGGHVIDNLRISDKKTKVLIDSMEGTVEIYLGLFQDAESIKNLGIGKRSTVTFYGGSKYTVSVFAAGLAAGAYRIENCFSDATVKIKGEGDTLIGGVVAQGSFITDSYHRGSIIVDGSVIDSRAKNKQGKIYPGELRVGGVCARFDKKITGCYNAGSINIKSSGAVLEIGGVSANTSGGTCTDLYNTGSIRITASGDIKKAYIGGVTGVGSTTPMIHEKPIRYVDSGYIYNKGNIDVTVQSGSEIFAGGITGWNKPGFNGIWLGFAGIYGCINTYNTGSISVTSTGKVDALGAGGIAGYGTMVINSYNTGSVKGSSGAGTALYIGGLGGSDVYVQNSYNTGTVSVKGAGSNFAGGIIGKASATWGETDKTLITVLNGFWLKQSKAGGINSNIKYGKGSYYYMSSGDIKKMRKETNLGMVIEAFDSDKEDPNTMHEAAYGAVFSFDNPAASVMVRTDDGPGKRANLNGTLLDNLNNMVEDKINRLYRRWVIDGTNGGYPVLSPKPTIYSNKPGKPDASAAKQISGDYLGENKQWTDNIKFNADGTFKRANGGDGGNWLFNGKRLILLWSKWEPEILEQKSDGLFSSNVYDFKLTRSGTTGLDNKPDAAMAKKIAGVYSAEHRYWNDNIIINADGTFKKAADGDSGTWSFDGKKMILKWSKWAPEILEQKADGSFSSPIYRFKLTRSASSASDTSTSDTSTADKPDAKIAKMIAGVYYAQHKDWTDSLIINSDGTFKRGNTGDGGTWTCADGRTLVLKWRKSAPETLLKSATGFYCPAYKFTLRQR